jgi:cation transport ATPase
MSSRKQRRRRQKVQRHEWEYVEVDEEGNESAVEPDKKKAVATEKAKAKGEQRTNRPARPRREVKPPSWNRALKRGALFVPFLYLFLTALEHVGPLPAVGVAVLYSAVFIPMFFFVDRMAYRAYRRKLGEG